MDCEQDLINNGFKRLQDGIVLKKGDYLVRFSNNPCYNDIAKPVDGLIGMTVQKDDKYYKYYRK